MAEPSTFWLHDTTFTIRTATLNDAALYDLIRIALRRAGFNWRQDAEIRARYRCLAPSHHEGRRKDVHFKAEIHPAHLSIEFYEDVTRDHPAGGKFTFDKLKKMPFETRLRTLKAMSIVRGVLIDAGIVDRSRRALADFHSVEAYVLYDRQQWGSHWPRSFDLDQRHPRARTDAGGQPLTDGCVRCFRTANGHLARGVCYFNLNEMWKVYVVGEPWPHQLHARRLFTFDPAKHVRKESSDSAAKIAKALARAVEAEDFERAIGIRNAIRRQQEGGRHVA